MKANSKKIGLYSATLHLIGFIVMVFFTNFSSDPQVTLLWGVFAIIDFPISLLYYFASEYAKFIDMFGQSFFVQLLYFPYVIHGLIGGIWWYFLPMLIMSKKFGGIWGKRT